MIKLLVFFLFVFPVSAKLKGKNRAVQKGKTTQRVLPIVSDLPGEPAASIPGETPLNSMSEDISAAPTSEQPATITSNPVESDLEESDSVEVTTREVITAEDLVSDQLCEEEPSTQSPFFVSDTYAQGDLEYENFRDLSNPNDNSLNRYIPRGSIVYTPPELMEVDDQVRRVPVQVLGVRTEIEETSRRADRARGGNWFRGLFGGYARDEARRVEQGDTGYLDNRSLKPAGEFVFYVEEDAPVYNLPSGETINGRAIRPRMLNDNTYLVQRCCFLTPNFGAAARNLLSGFQDSEDVLERTCFEHHVYDIFDENNNLVAESQILNGLGCGFFGDLEAIPTAIDPGIAGINNILQQNDQAIQTLGQDFGVEDLELLMVNATIRGESVREPTVRIPVNETTNLGLFNTRVYTPETENIDGRFNPMSTCAFLRVAQAWQEICNEPGCEIQYGNAYVHDDWGPHSSHDSARCMDIRPFRISSDEDNGLYYTNPEYSRERTTDFLDLLVRAGASRIIYGDASAVNMSNAVRRNTREVDPENFNPHRVMHDSGSIHDNHIHYCFDPDSEQVQETCEGELMETAE